MNKKILILVRFVIIGVVALSVSGCSSKEESIGQFGETEFAQTALRNYVNFALNENNVTGFGFKDLKEARTALVGSPHNVMYIGLKDLKEYKPGIPTKQLFADTSKKYFPVLVNGEVRTKIEIIQINGKWVAGDFGGVDAPKIIDMAIRKSAEMLNGFNIPTTETPTIVQIPVLHATFLYYTDSDGKEFFVPAMILPERFGIENGQFYPVEKLLQVLSEYSQSIKEDEIE